jgi:hypothetical protein
LLPPRDEAEGGPEDAWSLLELEVTGKHPRTPIMPIERRGER